mgnify:CR=1 FL=1
MLANSCRSKDLEGEYGLYKRKLYGEWKEEEERPGFRIIEGHKLHEIPVCAGGRIVRARTQKCC